MGFVIQRDFCLNFCCGKSVNITFQGWYELEVINFVDILEVIYGEKSHFSILIVKGVLVNFRKE